jgi:hypothetical protein
MVSFPAPPPQKGVSLLDRDKKIVACFAETAAFEGLDKELVVARTGKKPVTGVRCKAAKPTPDIDLVATTKRGQIAKFFQIENNIRPQPGRHCVAAAEIVGAVQPDDVIAAQSVEGNFYIVRSQTLSEIIGGVGQRQIAADVQFLLYTAGQAK